MRIFAVVMGLALPLLVNTAAFAQVKNWAYVGVTSTGASNVIVAKASVSDDVLYLIYSPGLKRYALRFAYRGNVTFSKKAEHKAEFFMRTRREPKLTGRYTSDYVFKGPVSVKPDSRSGALQFVTISLTSKDIQALRDYEKHDIIGVGYYTSGDAWRTYTLPAKGVWAAYRRIAAEAKTTGQKTVTRPAKRPAKQTASLEAAGQLRSASGAKKHFVYCAKLADRYEAAAARLDRSERRAGPAMAELRKRRSKMRRLEREAEDAQLKAKIIQSNENVQRKFRRAVRRYKKAVASFNEANDYIREQGVLFDRRRKESKRLDKKQKAECGGRWSTALVQSFCKSGDKRYANFCKELNVKKTN